jgi:hypothetical protein
MNWKLAAHIVAILVVPLSAETDSTDAGFGLKWFSSPGDISAAGVKLEKDNADNFFTMYKTASLPKNVTYAEEYRLIFYKDSSLVKLRVFSTKITSDCNGTSGKALFDTISTSLSKKYPEKSRACFTGAEVYRDKDEFYQCLQYEGCGGWFVFFKTSTKSVMLQLNGSDRCEGYITLSVESHKYSELLDVVKSIKTRKNGDAY